MRSPVDLFSIFCIIFCVSFAFPIATQADGRSLRGLSDEVEPRFFALRSAGNGSSRQDRPLQIDAAQAKKTESSRFFAIDRGRPATHHIDTDTSRPKRGAKPVAPPFVRRANLGGGNRSWVFVAQTAAPAPEPTTLAAAEPESKAFPRPESPRHAQPSGLHWPIDQLVSSRISSRFGWRRDPFTGERAFHGGLDIAAPAGTRVLATLAATVRAVGEHPRLGRYVMLDHGHDLISIYGHLSATLVSTGDRVASGDVVGKVGSTGRSTGPHLDYAVEYRGERIDPLKLLKGPITLARG